MRGFSGVGRSLRAALATRWADVRQAHPTRVLRWLRAGVLAMVATTALLYLVVSTQAGHRIAAARHTDRAIDDIVNAQDAARAANTTLKPVFTTGQVALIGTGTEFANDTARINTELTSAVEGNAAGRQGLTLFQFVQGQLTTCLQLAESAVRDYSRIAPQSTGTSAPTGTGADAGTRAGTGTATTADLGGQIVKDTLDALNHPEETYRGQAVARTGGLIQTLADLNALEQDALARQRHSAWLDPAVVWPLLVGPSAVMLLLVLATGSVLARHFRRPASRRLLSALLVSTGVGVVTAVLVGFDAHDLAAHPRAVHPVTLTVAPALLAAAAVLAYLAYRPRLAEYRFPRPGAAS
ncbi:hypothetical protein [Streptomyces sp. HPF1205]|uniref:hypothetical protein n=1 Tax=Streptomyces sp. HPF1205 TaxID=2873262 RepID=UPI001CEDB712|nr:hypothetical protein [Streptomyces sp. HPF1205]